MAKPTELVAAARDLLPVVDACWEETEAARRVPRDVVEQMRAAGLYSMVVPSEFGGAATDILTFVEVVETIAQGNGAAAWNLSASAIATLAVLALPRQVLEEIYSNGPNVIITGSTTIHKDGARAVPQGDGYSVTAHWRFGSGCADAEWFLGTAEVVNTGGTTRNFIFPRSDISVLDTWHVLGMRGTGSNDWTVTDVFVPAERSGQGGQAQGARPWRGSLFSLPMASMTALHFSSVATGLARRAIDELMDLAGVKTPYRTPGLLKARVQVQEALARAEVMLESARAYRDQVLRDIWTTLEAGEPLSMEQRARIRLAGVNVTESATKAVDLMYAAAGTTSIDDDAPLCRLFRDVHVVAQHVTVLPLYYELVGKVMLGVELDRPV